MKKIILAVMAASVLSGCGASSADRRAACEAEGISRDTCYAVEQNRKDTATAARAGASHKQAMENIQNIVRKSKAKNGG